MAYAFYVDDLTAHPLGGVFVQPAAMTRRPTARQADHIAAGMRLLDPDGDVLDVGEFVQDWISQPEPEAEGFDGWIELADLVRSERSLNGPLFRVPVAGSLMHTLIKPRFKRTKKIHDFGDRGDRLVQLLEGSYHPIGQVSPCTACDSGKPALDCCYMADQLDDPCICGRGRPFRDCCMVTDRNAVHVDHPWTGPFDTWSTSVTTG